MRQTRSRYSFDATSQAQCRQTILWRWRRRYPLNHSDAEDGAVPMAVEVRDNSEPLTTLEHPEKAVYIFGPEDGSIPKPWLHLCHRFVHIPANHCLNHSTAVTVVLAHR